VNGKGGPRIESLKDVQTIESGEHIMQMTAPQLKDQLRLFKARGAVMETGKAITLGGTKEQQQQRLLYLWRKDNSGEEEEINEDLSEEEEGGDY